MKSVRIKNHLSLIKDCLMNYVTNGFVKRIITSNYNCTPR